jgi:YebC/PmpR family DNA-binding regulatory protein
MRRVLTLADIRLFPVLQVPHRMLAGHSKWANIRHRKGAADAKRAKVFSKICVAIAAASRECKGDMGNFVLASLLSKAKANNVPKANVEAAIERGVSGKDVQGERITYEGVGPGNVSLIIEALTDNRKRTAPQVRAAFTKYGGSLGADGSVSWQFDRLGQCKVLLRTGHDLDSIFDVAIDAGATDVELLEDLGFDDDAELISETTPDKQNAGLTTASVLCAPNDLAGVRSSLVTGGFEISSAELIWQPKTSNDFVELCETSDEHDLFIQLLGALEDNDDVQEVFHNAK